MSSNHLILSHPLLLLPSIFPSIKVFSNESVLCIRWPKDWSFSFSISPSNEYSGLISFRMDCFDLLAVQGTLKSLLQHHSSKPFILQRSAFFMVQLCCLQSVFFHRGMNSLKTATLFHSFLSSLCLGWHSGTSLKNKTNEIKRNRGKKKGRGWKVGEFKKFAQDHPNGHLDSTSGALRHVVTQTRGRKVSLHPCKTAHIHHLPRVLSTRTQFLVLSSFPPTVVSHSGGDTCK